MPAKRFDKKLPVQASLEPEMFELIQKLAQDEVRSFSNMMEKLLFEAAEMRGHDLRKNIIDKAIATIS